MADLVLGLAKTTVEGTVTIARLAMEEEAKLQKSVQRDLLVISDEFEIMNSFLNDAKDLVTDSVTRTLVRQVRNMALDVEDCIEIIAHLDSKPHWWRRMMLPWCVPATAPEKDLDAAAANIEQLKARVEAMGQRNLRYSRIDDSGHKPGGADASAGCCQCNGAKHLCHREQCAEEAEPSNGSCHVDQQERYRGNSAEGGSGRANILHAR